MKSYDHIEEFLNDKSFRDWVLRDNPVERDLWQNWQSENPDKEGILLQAKTILLELDADGSDWEEKRKVRLFSGIKKRIDSQGKGDVVPRYPSRSSMEKWVRVGILVFLIAISSVSFLVSFAEEEAVPVVSAPEWVTKFNPKGQKSTIHLPDGSTVVLNSESTVRYESDFGQAHRDVFLQGESFFEVASDSLLPFRVFSGELVTVALGTSFNIDSYDEERVQVQLATGKVKVFSEGREEEQVFLGPGEEVLLMEDHSLRKKKFDLQRAFLWREGILFFEKTPFSEVVVDLERWYGVDIKVKTGSVGQVGKKRISAEFDNVYLSDLLESLGYAYGFDYRINGKEVMIMFDQND